MPRVRIFYGYQIPRKLYESLAYTDKNITNYSCSHIEENPEYKGKYCNKCGKCVSIKIKKGKVKTSFYESLNALGKNITVNKMLWSDEYVYLTTKEIDGSPHNIYHKPLNISDLYNEHILKPIIEKELPEIANELQYGLFVIDNTDYGSDCW